MLPGSAGQISRDNTWLIKQANEHSNDEKHRLRGSELYDDFWVFFLPALTDGCFSGTKFAVIKCIKIPSKVFSALRQAESLYCKTPSPLSTLHSQVSTQTLLHSF